MEITILSRASVSTDVHEILGHWTFEKEKQQDEKKSRRNKVYKSYSSLCIYIMIETFKSVFYVLLTVRLSIFISVINKLHAQNFCFTISLFHASTCFEHMCLKHVEA